MFVTHEIFDDFVWRARARGSASLVCQRHFVEKLLDCGFLCATPLSTTVVEVGFAKFARKVQIASTVAAMVYTGDVCEVKAVIDGPSED